MDYIQIDRTNCMEIILQEFPAFQTQWDLHLASWSPQIDRPIALDIAEFADFAVDTICEGIEARIDRLAATLQLMLLQGDAVIEYTFRTMFLEQIAQQCYRGGCAIEIFTSKLQPLSAYHWQAIDRHWHIHPSGLASKH
ncbi:MULTISPECIES: hypothetical protein [unclassified Chamaesiphon]|uniref:DUF7674 family protein n=1 Tax=unclassified Chamaesiphon TaxID=2620921 RepID=UPI00286D6077|nr:MULTISPECIES: hypothetical protein [unclassified Chamaesiphon]